MNRKDLKLACQFFKQDRFRNEVPFQPALCRSEMDIIHLQDQLLRSRMDDESGLNFPLSVQKTGRSSLSG